ncbi:ferredoxin-thioredoxin reductase catalytic chain [Lyngbya sp. CCY1209]|jgi:hypothetical protein|uniref:ferredoxin-thioredoxin reductase catalytic chain n=1 Tax=Lyngbya sp. CCY1209 TaxID=2886103 RepID=UPI002D21685B|nr:ferredoxin-thioredoxin reductase catalytic chain [Lyngbya sp. CCY1209]MEB3883361.1 ferredoxin-thioredoxin reductase catalytic chain [Lyngbya sp. CCY1209]
MYSDRERSSDLSPETSEFSHNHPVDAVGTSELPPALKAASIVALIVVLFGTLIGSLAVSPRPTAMEAEEEIEDTVATEEPAMEEAEQMATTPAASVTEDEMETAGTATETEATALETDGTATSESPSPVAADTAPSEPTTSEPVATAEPELPESPAATGTTEMAETPGMGTDATPAAAPTAGEEMAAAPGAVDVDQLNEIVYDKVDRAWTVKGTPVTAQVSYLVTVTPEGAIAKFEPNSPDAKDNVENTPLPGLAESDGMAGQTSGQTVTFEVVFSDTGALEVKPSQ